MFKFAPSECEGDVAFAAAVAAVVVVPDVRKSVARENVVIQKIWMWWLTRYKTTRWRKTGATCKVGEVRERARD
jgi:hypothetical protein